MKIVTFNLRCVWKGDGVNAFMHRAGLIYEKIQEEKPDIIGFQEVVEKSLELMKRMLPEYSFIGQFRSENYDGEGLYTAIRKDTMELLGLETIWLSPTPYIAGSRFPKQSVCPRICVMTQLRNKTTGEILRVYNVHLDFISDEVALLQLKQTLRLMEEYEQKMPLPSVLLGDFNFEPNSKTIKEFEKYSQFTDVTKNISSTFHDFGRRKEDYKIDYIFVTNDIYPRVAFTDVWEDCNKGIYLSDHYPVCMILND